MRLARAFLFRLGVLAEAVLNIPPEADMVVAAAVAAIMNAGLPFPKWGQPKPSLLARVAPLLQEPPLLEITEVIRQ